MKQFLSALPLLLLLAACQPRTETPLVLPTPIVDSAEGDATPEPTATDVPQETATVEATSTATAAIPFPTVENNPKGTPTIHLPPPIDEPVESATGLQVAFVELGDTLNVRSGPGVDYPVVAELPPDASGLVMDDPAPTLVAGSTWVYIEGEGAEGYVNSRFLTETVAPDDYCGNAEMDGILQQLRDAIAGRDGEQLAALVHPERGLRLRHNWWNEEILVPGEDVAGLFSDDTVYDWGTADGSGLPITGTFDEVMLPLLDQDLTAAQASACAELLSGPTAGLVVLPEGYEAVPYASFYRASADVEFDWGTWVVGVERWGGHYYLSYLVHYAYEI